jgi:hypothetical protein
MYASILGDASFHAFCLEADRDLAERTRQGRCIHCGAALHRADYLRHPRGLGQRVTELGPEFAVCFSFCCGARGCRRRHQAPSLRFLGRRIYLFAMVLLISAMRQGASPRTAGELKRLFGVDRRTLARWRTWWQAAFPRADLWRAARGLLRRSISEDGLPRSLLELLAEQASDLRERVMAALKFLSGLLKPSSAF